MSARGYALLEVLLAISLLIALSIGAVLFHGQTRAQVAADSLTSTITIVGTRLRANYASKPDLYAGVSSEELLSIGQVSGISYAGRGYLQDNEGNRFTVYPVDLGGLTSGGFSVTLIEVPREICTAVAVSAASSFVLVTINTVDVGNARLGDGVTAAEAAFNCRDVGNYVDFVGS